MLAGQLQKLVEIPKESSRLPEPQTPSAAGPHQQLQKLRLVKPAEAKALVGGFNWFQQVLENLPYLKLETIIS